MALFGRSEDPVPAVLERSLSAMSSRSVSGVKDQDEHSGGSGNGGDGDSGDHDADDGDSNNFPRPFQRLDFLVRDWQDFSRKQTIQEKRADMATYMTELLASRKQKDLADTREQISSCFEKVACFLLPHPGHEVTEREYDGSVDAIDSRFLELLTTYLDDVFDPKHLVPKKIHGVPVTSRELYTYIKTYAALFREATIFPEAKTLLEATAEANNVNMKDKALLKYKREMEAIAGSNCRYVPVQELEAHHQLCVHGAVTIFDAGAKMGRHSQILKFRADVIAEIEREHHRFVELNAERDPYKNLEFYLVPGALAIALLVFRVAQDLMCYENIGYDIPLYDCKYVGWLTWSWEWMGWDGLGWLVCVWNSLGGGLGT